VEIIYNDDDWLVVNKPAGISTYGSFPGDRGVVELLESYRGEKLHCFSRLDKDTSGVLILARHARAMTQAQTWQRQGKLTKTYVFLSTHDAQRQRGEARWRCEGDVEGKPALTEFTQTGRSGRYFVYEAKISSGRKHQIRRHAKESRISILGDRDYEGAPFPRVCLHCRETTLPGQEKPFAAPLPFSFGYRGDFESDPGFLVALDRRLRFDKDVTTAFRCLQRGEMKSWDGAIDYFGGTFCVWNYEDGLSPAAVAERLAPHLKKLASVYETHGYVIKCAVKDPHSQGLIPQQETFGEVPAGEIEITELGLRYGVDVSGGQHVGFFPDQRDNRLRVRRHAQGREVANLFSYTCSFSVAALAGGSEHVVSVDVAAPALEKGKANVARNGFDLGKASFVKNDVRAWLAREARKSPGRYGLVVCDPPTFAKTKDGGLFSLAKEWPDLVRLSRELLGKGGVALFCNNHREGERVVYRGALQKSFTTVTDLMPPLDYPVVNGQESVRMFWCET
jgi:23S rRNA (cytosine1962-C5)-methyltransferase